MSTVIEFCVPTADTLNSNHRLHHHAKAKRTANLRSIARQAADAQGFQRFDRARIICRLSFGDSRRRDAGNWYPSAKACVDGFVDVGILDDDDSTRLIGPDMRIGPKRDQGLVWFTFEVTTA